MAVRSILLATLLVLGILLAGLINFGAEGALPPTRIEVPLPPLAIDPLELLARQAAEELFRLGCLEVAVMVFPDPQGLIHLAASCTEWREIRPASQ